jgi:DNA-binding IscR family transcriptional regulator
VKAGWTFAKRPEAITLLDVYDAVEDAPIFALRVSPPNRNCPIGRGVQPALKKIYGTLERELRERLSRSSWPRSSPILSANRHA